MTFRGTHSGRWLACQFKRFDWKWPGKKSTGQAVFLFRVESNDRSTFRDFMAVKRKSRRLAWPDGFQDLLGTSVICPSYLDRRSGRESPAASSEVCAKMRIKRNPVMGVVMMPSLADRTSGGFGRLRPRWRCAGNWPASKFVENKAGLHPAFPAGSAPCRYCSRHRHRLV